MWQVFTRILPTGLLLAINALQCNAKTIEGRVIAVRDGDTIAVLDASKTQHEVRLTGIDAPEKRQAFGRQSKESLGELAFGKNAIVDTHKIDLYGRVIGKVIIDGKDVNLAQVQRGLAWHYKQYAKEQSVLDRAAYVAAENAAKEAKIGLWIDADPIPPWVWRHESKPSKRSIK